MLGQREISLIERGLEQAVTEDFMAGVSVMAILGGEEVLYRHAGWADRGLGKPIARDSIFRLYSMTKPVTAAAVMMLLERGLVDLYEPVSAFLPGFKDQRVEVNGKLEPSAREMVLKDLLSMTSGLVYAGEGRAGQETLDLFREIDQRLLGDDPMGTVEIANRLGGCALAFQPGSNWQYGTSADVLGAIVEVVSGRRFGDFLESEFFSPLGMADTAFYVPQDKASRLVVAYEADSAGKLHPYLGNHLGIINAMDRNPAFQSGGAGLASTIDDYARFAAMLMNGGSLGGHQILRPKTVDYLTSTTLSATQQRGFDDWLTLAGHSYGNLMRVMTDSRRAGGLGFEGEYGWDGWLGAYFCNCPKEGLTILAMMQKTGAGTNALTRKLRNIIISAF